VAGPDPGSSAVFFFLILDPDSGSGIIFYRISDPGCNPSGSESFATQILVSNYLLSLSILSFEKLWLDKKLVQFSNKGIHVQFIDQNKIRGKSHRIVDSKGADCRSEVIQSI
jgi:hypothetical protein